MQSQTDPIIAEVRAIRQAYAARFDYDVDAIFEDMRARQTASGSERGHGSAQERQFSETQQVAPDTGEEQETANLHVMYANCMEEIKKRTLVIDGYLKGELTARYLQTTAECVSLQLRKILELIALASMVANQPEYKKHRRNFQREWNGKRILATLEEANPEFYPVPTMQIRDRQTGRVVETKTIDSGFLTKTDYVRLYDACGSILHARNPFAGGGRDAGAFLSKTPMWMERIRVLLNHHQIRLLDTDKQIWVLMQAEADGRVNVYEFQRVPESRGPGPERSMSGGPTRCD